jgi:hypothetical protein
MSQEADVLNFQTEVVRTIGASKLFGNFATSDRDFAGVRTPQIRVQRIEIQLAGTVASLASFRVAGKLPFDCSFVRRLRLDPAGAAN